MTKKPAPRTPALEALFLTEAEIAVLYEAFVVLAQEINADERRGAFKCSPLYPIYLKLLRLWEGEKL